MQRGSLPLPALRSLLPFPLCSAQINCLKSGNIFLRLLCLDLLVEEARLDARTHLQQRAHLKVRGHYCLEAGLLTANVKKWMFPLKCFFFQGRGSSHWLCLPDVPPLGEQANKGAHSWGGIFFIYFINFSDDQNDQVFSIIYLTRATCRLCAMLWRSSVNSWQKRSLLLSSAWTADSWYICLYVFTIQYVNDICIPCNLLPPSTTFHTSYGNISFIVN